MMQIRVYLIIVLAFSSFSCTESYAQDKFQEVDLQTDNIQVLGANYVFRTESKISYSRFSVATLTAPMQEAMFNADKAKTNSGIRIKFMTSSPELCLSFVPEPGINRGAEFAVLQNGIQSQVFTFNGVKAKQEMELKLKNEQGNKTTTFEIVLPSLANVALNKLALTAGYHLQLMEKDQRPIYLAIGNSITHGVGQGSATHLTYPFLLAKTLNFNYYNLAVGGAKISQAIARMTAEMPQANLITILIGYNDLMFNKSVQQYISDYTAYLDTIRKNQPLAKSYCITLTYTRATENTKTGIKPEQYREALNSLVMDLQRKGDDKLFVIEGDKMTSNKNLRQDKMEDKVHFSIEGAALFAEELAKIVKK